MNHRRRSPQRRRIRGIMLFELMIALGLFATFSLVVVYVARVSLRVPQQAGGVASLAARFDGAVEQLRRDVWGATSVQAADPGGKAIRIERQGSPAIGWAISDDGALVRSGPPALAPEGAPSANANAPAAEQQEWPDVARGMSFEVDGPVLLLVEPPTAKTDGRRMPVINPVQALRGRTLP